MDWLTPTSRLSTASILWVHWLATRSMCRRKQ